MKNEYTKEQKQQYFKNLRKRWNEAKQEAEKGNIKALISESLVASEKGFSVVGYVLVKKQMDAHGFKGEPYIDAKTFKGWIDAGYKVQKGEKSVLEGITWIKAKKNNTASENEHNKDEKSFLMPKIYKLFHKSQVVELNYNK